MELSNIENLDLSVYTIRKKEIDDFIKIMSLLEKYENTKNNSGLSKFEEIFKFKENNIDLCYGDIINILKSNVSLMIYNIVEYTISYLLDCIYDEIKNKKLSYKDVNNFIRARWREIYLKSLKDPNSNYSTVIKKNENMINFILNNKIIELQARNNLPEGNLDGETINKLFCLHGIKLDYSNKKYRPDLLKNIKDKRNNLAHGSVSFVEALRDQSIKDIENSKNFITSFLWQTIIVVSNYIKNREYMQIK